MQWKWHFHDYEDDDDNYCDDDDDYDEGYPAADPDVEAGRGSPPACCLQQRPCVSTDYRLIFTYVS